MSERPDLGEGVLVADTRQNTWTFLCIEREHDRCKGTTAGGNPCTCPCHNQRIHLSPTDVDRILDWFVTAHREVDGSCGPEANDLVRRLQEHARKAAPSGRSTGGDHA